MQLQRLQLPNGRTIEFAFYRKKIRNLHVRIDALGAIRVSAPSRMAYSQVEDFLYSKTAWIERHLQNALTALNWKEPVQGLELPLLGSSFSLQMRIGSISQVSIEQHQIVLQSGPRATDQTRRKLLRDFYQEQAQDLFNRRLELWMPVFAEYGLSFWPTLHIRRMKSRYGTCYPAKRQIVLNTLLVMGEVRFTDYLLCHEVAHFFHGGHQKPFQDTIEAWMPQWRQVQRDLKNALTPYLYQDMI